MSCGEGLSRIGKKLARLFSPCHGWRCVIHFSYSCSLHQHIFLITRIMTHAQSLAGGQSRSWLAVKHRLTLTSKGAVAEDVDVLDIKSSIAPSRRSKQHKNSAPRLALSSTLEETATQAVNLAEKLPPTCSIEGSRMVTQSSQPPQREPVTACPTQGSLHRQRENQPISRPGPSDNNSLLDSSASLKQRPATIPEDYGYGYSKPKLPTRVLLAKRTFKHKASGKSKHGRANLLDLPLDILCLIADHLDRVARVCLRYAHPALGYWCNGDLGNLSLCAKSGIVSLLLRDGASIPGQLLGVARKGTHGGHCSEYQETVPKYCVECRCHGHLSHCPGCQIRTCAREGTRNSKLIFLFRYELES